ncbi:MAG: NADH-quinone oxidoreductase subunit C [Elusimicrobia bacterium]|nr:NADH-quinone oxidoreductase subunit C [Elusimicrobiota bacterium]MDE2425444.1 NADH-quinone oxidoreductase subunit C [Elusimicrobiota bacterium]
MADIEELASRIAEKLPELSRHPNPVKGYLTLKLEDAAKLPQAAAALKALGFDYLEMISATDWLGAVKPEGYIRNPNPIVFLPEGATPQSVPSATPGFPYRPSFELLWAFADLAAKAWVFLKCEVSREAASVPSLSGLYKGADWQERELFDLMGIRFEGHPNLAKILTPDFLVGHPLRKDYVHVKDRFDE